MKAEDIREWDDTEIQNGGAFGLCAVLERFFARSASINSFTRTALRSRDHGEVMRWPTRIGQRKSV